MQGRFRGWWRFPAIVVIAGVTLWLLRAGWHSEHEAVYLAAAVPLVVAAAGLTRSIWRAHSTAAPTRDPDHAADVLAAAVKRQWEQEAGERGLTAPEPIPVTWGSPLTPLAGPAAAAAESRQFRKLPGLAPVREAQLSEGKITDLHAVYGGLGSGRLVIVGGPGSGKTGAAVLLILTALNHRNRPELSDHRKQIPVPVLFTAREWDPRRQPVTEFLARRLQETYPQLFAGKAGAATATELIAAGKIAVILDGLDEIGEELRPIALQALSEQASFRLVLLSRTAEMATAAKRHGLRGAVAVELHPVHPATAAGYLERVQLHPPPDGWRDFISRLRASPASPLARALNTPLALTLVRDTYHQEDDVRELLNFADAVQRHTSGTYGAGEITAHLLDRVLPAAYAPRPGQPPPRYGLATARNALVKIAARMNRDGTRDLKWWLLPAWARALPRALSVGLMFGLMFGLVSVLGAGRISGLVLGLVIALVTGITAGARGEAPRRIAKLRIRRVMSRVNLAFGLVTGLLTGLFFGPWIGCVVGLGGCLVAGLVAGLRDPGDTVSPSPVASWRNDRRYAVLAVLLAGLVTWIVFETVFVFVFGLRPGLVFDFRAGLVGGLGVGLVTGMVNSQAWSSSLAAVQLALRWHTPLRLIRFLDDARERGVLRTVGPVYQFRHARLQDRLAAAADDSNNDSTASRPEAQAGGQPGRRW